MKLARIAAAVLAVTVCASAAAPSAFAQAAAPAAGASGKIVSANMQRIFADAQERKDLEAKFKTRGQDAQKQAQDGQQRVTALQEKRKDFRPGSAEYEKVTSELTRAAVEVQVASGVLQQDLIREQKRSTRTMVEKIVAAVDALSKEKGYGIVLMQVLPPELSEEAYERMTPEQLNQLLSSRNVLYVAPESDITAEVVARLDAAYKSGK